MLANVYRVHVPATVAALAVGVLLGGALAGCSTSHSPEYRDGYSYGHSAARQDYSGSLTGSAADDACNHALQAVPDGFGDPSNADWVAGFMAGCKAELAHAGSLPRPGAGIPGSSAPATPHMTASCIVGYEQPKPDPDVLASEVTSADYTHSTFKTGTPVGITLNGDYWAPTKAYKLTVANASRQAITIQAFTVSFSNASGRGVGSDAQQNIAWPIGPGRSQSWTQLAGQAMGNASDGPTGFSEHHAGNVTDSTGFGGGPPDTASTCRLSPSLGSAAEQTPGAVIHTSGGGALQLAPENSS